MDYVVSNITPKREIRVSSHELEGRLIYKGHKLGLPDNLLPEILNHTYERYTNTFYFLDYRKWKELYHMEKLNNRMKCWFTDTDNKTALMKSYNTLLEILKEENKNFRNIYIVEN